MMTDEKRRERKWDAAIKLRDARHEVESTLSTRPFTWMDEAVLADYDWSQLDDLFMDEEDGFLQGQKDYVCGAIYHMMAMLGRVETPEPVSSLCDLYDVMPTVSITDATLKGRLVERIGGGESLYPSLWKLIVVGLGRILPHYSMYSDFEHEYQWQHEKRSFKLSYRGDGVFRPGLWQFLETNNQRTE